MSKRQKIEDRALFSRDERLEILEKSNGRCSHCGVDLNGFFTVDHVIPLNKGGTNKPSNLVALCEDCNKSKDGMVVDPSSYFKFLKPDILSMLIKNQEIFCEEFKWLTNKTLLPEDMKELSIVYRVKLPGMTSKAVKGGYVNSRYTTITCYIKRAIKSDFDRILDFCYNTTKSLLHINDVKFKIAMEHDVESWFKKGAVYYLTNKDGSIRAVMPVVFVGYLDEFNSDKKPSKEDGLLLYFLPAYKYKQEFNYDVAIARSYIYILSNMVKVLNRPVYYAGDVNVRYGLGSFEGMNTVTALAEETYNLDYRRGDGTIKECIYSGKWGSSDDSLLGNENIDQIKKRLCRDTIVDLPTNRDDFGFENGIPQLWSLTELDVDKYLKERRIFSKSLARYLGHRVATESIHIEYEDPYETIDLPLESLKIPVNAEVPKVVPSYIKNQLKCGGLRPIEITATYEIKKADLGIYAYYMEKGVKSVKCRYKKGIILESKN